MGFAIGRGGNKAHSYIGAGLQSRFTQAVAPTAIACKPPASANGGALDGLIIKSVKSFSVLPAPILNSANSCGSGPLLVTFQTCVPDLTFEGIPNE